jgi:hypothetical protein
MYKFTIESVEQHVGYTYLIVDLQKICAKKNITCERERERERERELYRTLPIMDVGLSPNHLKSFSLLSLSPLIFFIYFI